MTDATSYPFGDSSDVTNRSQYEQFLLLCTQAGTLLLQFGGETSRVEETIAHLALSAGFSAHEVQSFVTPTGIFVSMNTPSGTQTKLTRVRGPFQLNLAKVTEINELSRRFSRGECTISEAQSALVRIETARPIYPLALRRACAGISSGSFTVVLGGSAVGFLIAALSGLLAQLVTEWLAAYVPRFFGVLLAGLCSAFLASSLADFVHAPQTGAIIVGAVLPLLPGLAVTNAIRDLLAGDLLSGVARGAEALFTAVAISVAVTVAISLHAHAG
ncbi:MAG: threonine/serine exporter family protein [Firmicutes bacterium]|nr:threonine/serine exporter family protein [Bacillota bacterium]